MITYSDNLYLSDSIKHVNRIKRKIKYGRGQIKVFLLTLSNSSDQIDIFHNSMLKQKFYRKMNLRIIGIANSYDEALIIVQDILEDTIKDTGTYDMKEYLMSIFANKE